MFRRIIKPFQFIKSRHLTTYGAPHYNNDIYFFSLGFVSGIIVTKSFKL
jgi:hypothetical protein